MTGSDPTAHVDLQASVNVRFASATLELSDNVAGLHFRLLSEIASCLMTAVMPALNKFTLRL